MVYLRSGQIAKNAPEKKYQNPEDVFRKETREEFRKKFANMESVNFNLIKGQVRLKIGMVSFE